MSKEEWKESGTELGHAFKTFGKTFVRSAERTTDKVVDWADDITGDGVKRDGQFQEQPNSSVFSDGSWKKVGQELTDGFAGIGKAMLHSVGLDKDDENKN